jgi:hypothetical protein
MVGGATMTPDGLGFAYNPPWLAITVEGKNMIRTNPYYFYGFGHATSRLLSVAFANQPLNDWRWSNCIEQTNKWIENFSSFSDDEVPLPKSKHASLKLKDSYEWLEKEINADSGARRARFRN